MGAPPFFTIHFFGCNGISNGSRPGYCEVCVILNYERKSSILSINTVLNFFLFFFRNPLDAKVCKVSNNCDTPVA